MSWAALPASAQAGHGGPAGDPLTNLAVSVRVNAQSVPAVAVDVSDAVAVNVAQTVTVEVGASRGDGGAAPAAASPPPAEPAPAAPPAEPVDDAEPGPSGSAPPAESNGPVEQQESAPATGRSEPAETRPAPEPAGTGTAPEPAAPGPPIAEPRRESTGTPAPKAPRVESTPRPSVAPQLREAVPPWQLTGVETAPVLQPSEPTAAPPRDEPRAHRDPPRRAESSELPYVDIAPPPTELPGSAGGQAAAGSAAAAGLLVTLILLTLTGITLRQRIAERRLSSLLWSTDVDRPG